MTRPLLYVQDLLPRLDPDLLAEGSVDDKIQAGIDRLLAMQTPSGGFGIWPGDPDPVLWGTAYVVHLLLDARDRGYRVPEDALREAIDWLDRNAERTDGGPKFRGTHPGYVQYVLARAGKPHTGTATRLLAELGAPDALDGPAREGRMLLMAALYVAGDRRHAKELRAPDTSPIETRRYNDWSYYSDLRRRGMTLTVHHELFGRTDGGRPLADLVAAALAGRDAHGFTTQELMWGVSGLGRWVGGRHGGVPGAKLRFDGKGIGASRGRSRKDGEMAWQVSGGSRAAEVVLELPGPPEDGTSLVVTTEGVRPDVVPPVGNHGLELTRTWHAADGTPVKLGEQALGDLVYVRLVVTNPTHARMENVAVVDRIPAGWEIENPRLGRGVLPDWVRPDRLWTLDYLDVKDDRYMAFGGLDARETATMVYAVRATTAGRFTMPGAHAEAMYDPDVWSRIGPVEGVFVSGAWNAP